MAGTIDLLMTFWDIFNPEVLKQDLQKINQMTIPQETMTEYERIKSLTNKKE